MLSESYVTAPQAVSDTNSDFTKSSGQFCTSQQSAVQGMLNVSTFSASEASPKSRDPVEPTCRCSVELWKSKHHWAMGGSCRQVFQSLAPWPENSRRQAEGSKGQAVEPSLLYNSDINNIPSCWLFLLPCFTFPHPHLCFLGSTHDVYFTSLS